MKGTVEWYNNVEGWGVIDADDCEREVHVDFDEIDCGGFPTLDAGERVEFEVDETGDGLVARNVVRIGDPRGDSRNGGVSGRAS